MDKSFDCVQSPEPMSKLYSVVAACNRLGGRDSTRDYALINESESDWRR